MSYSSYDSSRIRALTAGLQTSVLQHAADSPEAAAAVGTTQDAARAKLGGAQRGGATLNNPNLTGLVRFPRLRVLTGGKSIPGAIELSVTSNNYYQADHFNVEFALYADPNYGVIWWGNQDVLLVDLQASLNNGQSWQSLLIGEVDKIDVDMTAGLVRVEGRDLSSRLIEAKTQETFLNQTSSTVAQTLAARHGLTADVQATSTLVGRFYKTDHDHITGNEFSRTTTEWDLLSYLAQEEDFDVWVTGTTLHFKPRPKEDATPWLIKWQSPNPTGYNAVAGPQSNAISLHLDRSLVLAKDIIVEVHSWHSRQSRKIKQTASRIDGVFHRTTTAPAVEGFTRIASSGGGKSKVKAGKAQIISVQRPNLTEDQAQKLANSILADATKHERLLKWTEPGELTLTARNMAKLEGTGSSWDQVYFINNITRRIHFEQGFVMEVNAKNHSTHTQLATP